MRRIFQVSMLCVAAGVVSACSPEQVIETDEIPTAGVRFINAVPDTGAMDFRFVDIVENSAHWNVAFRDNPVTSACITASTQVQFKPARAGQRTFKIFMYGTTPAVASTVVHERTVSLEAGKNYTALLWGYANPTGPGRPASAPAMRLDFFEETPPDPGNQVALRVINASGNTLDISYYPTSGAPPGTAIASNLAPMTISNYVTAPRSRMRFYVQPSGGGGPILADALALPGDTAQTSEPGPFDASPGTNVAGSAVTGIIFPPAVSGSQAPGFSLTTGNTAALSANDSGYARQAGSFVGDCFFIGQQITVSGFTNAVNNGTSIIRGIRESSTTGSISMGATATGYTRTATATNSFITNGFVVGQTITASGFADPRNNGRSVVIAVTATTLTVSKPGGTVAEAAATGRTITADGILTVTKTGGTALEAGTTGATELAATTTGYRRNVGSFITDGFIVGQTISASGFTDPQNNGNSVIDAVTDTELTVTKTGGTVVEAGSTGPDALGATPAGYTRTTGSFIAEGFRVGHRVRASGFFDSANNGLSTVTGVTATTLSVSKTPQTVTEAAAVGRTITNVDGRIIANARARSLAGVGGRIWSFIWDRRPPRPPGT
jgi:hypothetical protein